MAGDDCGWFLGVAMYKIGKSGEVWVWRFGIRLILMGFGGSAGVLKEVGGKARFCRGGVS